MGKRFWVVTMAVVLLVACGGEDEYGSAGSGGGTEPTGSVVLGQGQVRGTITGLLISGPFPAAEKLKSPVDWTWEVVGPGEDVIFSKRDCGRALYKTSRARAEADSGPVTTLGTYYGEARGVRYEQNEAEKRFRIHLDSATADAVRGLGNLRKLLQNANVILLVERTTD